MINTFSCLCAHQKEVEYLNRVQGNELMAAYEAKFIELARFAPHIIANELTRARKFLCGLRPSIHTKLTPFMLTKYSNIINRALVVENNENFRKTREREGKKRYRLCEVPKERNFRKNFQKNQPARLIVQPLPL